MSTPEELLACALTYRAEMLREEKVGRIFNGIEEAVDTWMSVLLHEAHEAMKTPLENPPPNPYLHPVDVHTTDPGIVDKKDGGHVLRCRPDIPRVVYIANCKERVHPNHSPCVVEEEKVEEEGSIDNIQEEDIDKAFDAARKALQKNLHMAEKKAETVGRNTDKQKERKEARARETEQERSTRLSEARSSKEARNAKKEAHSESQEGGSQHCDTTRKRRVGKPPLDEESMLIPDVSLRSVLSMEGLTKRRKGKGVLYYQHPVPHHRHMTGMQLCDPNPKVLGALLSGTECDNVEVIQGPPGTGKTRELVHRAACAEGRVFLCAPTNVGAVNLYNRCVQEGLGQRDAALVISADRVPPGTPILSNDRRRRIVCSTISARSGKLLMSERFDNVFIDEAAQCMEAWVWTLFRADVCRIVLAGDVKQLPACTSESGVLLRHERSLMERLVIDLGYKNTVSLSVQNRMAPQILSFPNLVFYEGGLTSGEHAPTSGSVEVHLLPNAKEMAVGTSFCNTQEACVVAKIAEEDENSVIITPYIAQVQTILAKKTGKEVHTIDSFQGKESDTVILSIVRDGSTGIGFWSDPRRLTVALTRARKRLVVVASGVENWPSTSLLRRFVEEHTQI
jgi:hypothetical protein